MAGIWLSVLIGGLLILLTVVALIKVLSPSPVEVKPGTVLRIELSGTLVDRASEPTLLDLIDEEYNTYISLSDIVNSIQKAKTDSRIEGIVLDCAQFDAGLAQCEEIMAAIKDFRSAGKWVVAYSDMYSQGGYFIAASADEIIVNPVGMIDIHGLSATTFYLKDLLDKVGVEAQVVKVGTYKSAVEPFLLNGMSEANREQIDHFLGRIWGNMSATIAESRKISADSINLWADSYCFSQPADFYTTHKIVDRTAYRRQIDDMVKQRTGVSEAQYVEFKDYLTAMKAEENTGGKASKRIAVLYALGDITEDAADGIASDKIVPEILKLAEDSEIDGLVMRVNSGGGSAFASEQIWEALEQFKRSGKPFYVSMGDMAASGGYYISCGADRIYASPLTLTGSIGIFGVIPNVEPLLSDKLGVNVVTVETNSGSFPTLFSPMTPGQRDAMQAYVDRGYQLFVDRCATSRGKTFDQIAEVAQGRVWDGQSALEFGLVDELGGLRSAIDGMAKKLGVNYSDLEIVQYPEINEEWWAAFANLENQQMYSALSGIIDPQSALYAKMVSRLRNMYPLQCRMNYLKIK